MLFLTDCVFSKKYNYTKNKLFINHTRSQTYNQWKPALFKKSTLRCLIKILSLIPREVSTLQKKNHSNCKAHTRITVPELCNNKKTTPADDGCPHSWQMAFFVLPFTTRLHGFSTMGLSRNIFVSPCVWVT